MQKYFGEIEQLNDFSEVHKYIRDVCQEQGAVRTSYHFSPIFDDPNSIRTDVYADGYSKEWLDLYDRADFRLADPIPKRTLDHGTLLTWTDAMGMGPNTPENEAYFEAMREFGLVHGFGVPLYGPRGRNSYASFDFDQPIDQIDDKRLGIVRSAAQASHQRICVLLDALHEAPELSGREREVMSWIARGKSISSIATILELSPDTVKTYSKRVYNKLGTSDRVGATVKALKLGLIKA